MTKNANNNAEACEKLIQPVAVEGKQPNILPDRDSRKNPSIKNLGYAYDHSKKLNLFAWVNCAVLCLSQSLQPDLEEMA